MDTLAEIISNSPLSPQLVQGRLAILVHLLAALVAGGAIGIERSIHGRPAGFRTHALVCLAASLLMLLTVYEQEWFPAATERVRIDPTRMAQGIMTGIGFLGAGVIFKEGLNVRGLTTAASIWTTSAIGILIGGGLYYPAFAGTVLTLLALAAFRWLEDRIPVHHFASTRVRFAREETMPEQTLRDLLARHRFSIAALSYRLTDDGRMFEYRLMIRTTDAASFTRLAHSLAALPAVREFEVSPPTE